MANYPWTSVNRSAADSAGSSRTSEAPLAQTLAGRGPLLVLGAKGQLGRALLQRLSKKPDPLKGRSAVVGLSRSELDLSDLLAVERALNELQPAAVLNAAAYTAVDQAESEPAQAHRLNEELPARLARYCAQQQIPLVHYSTDYVFSGQGERAWQEDDPASPLNVYGESKRLGEEAIEKEGGRYLIFRTSWVFDEEGKNFVNTMLRLGAEREELKVVSDQVGAPTYAGHLAELSLKALQRGLAQEAFPSGIYHLSAQGHTTWFDFAQAIFAEGQKRGLRLKVQRLLPILSQDYTTPAERPLNSRLDLNRFISTFALQPPHWEEGLRACLDRRMGSQDGAQADSRAESHDQNRTLDRNKTLTQNQRNLTDKEKS